MEKASILSCIDSGRKFKDKKTGEEKSIYTTTASWLKNGQPMSATGTSFEMFEPGEKEIEIKESEYNGKTQYTFFIPKQNSTNSTFAKKDWTFEKRKASLECAVNTSKGNYTSQQILEVAKVYFEYLNQK